MADRDRDSRTTVNTVKTDRAGGKSALWLILGGVLVALLIFFFVVSGDDDVADGVVGDGADAPVIVDGENEPVEGTAGTVDGAAPTVEGTAAPLDGAAPTAETPAPGN